MKVIISTSSSKVPEVDKIYWLRERQQINRRGRLVTTWITHESAIRVTAIRGNKVMVKNAFGKQDLVKAKGIELSSIGVGKQFKLLPYERKASQTLADKNTSNTSKVVHEAKVKALREKEKQLRKDLLDVEKQLKKLGVTKK